MDNKPTNKLDELLAAILEGTPLPKLAAGEATPILAAILKVLLETKGRTHALEGLVRDVALNAHHAAGTARTVADRLESFARDPHRWTLESFRNDLDTLAADLRGAWRMLDGIVGGDTVEEMDQAIWDTAAQDEIVRGVAERFNVDPDGPERKASMIGEATG